MMTARQVVGLEPNVRAAAALHSPQTGIVDSHALMADFLHRARDNGAHLVCPHGSDWAGKRRKRLADFSPAAKKVKEFEFRVLRGHQRGRTFVRCHRRHGRAAATGFPIARETTAAYPESSRVSSSRLIYPAPSENSAGLGVHLTMDLARPPETGAGTRLISNGLKTTVSCRLRQPFFMRKPLRFFPFCIRKIFIPIWPASARKLQGPGDPFQDFVIREDVPGLVNLVGIESPGLTRLAGELPAMCGKSWKGRRKASGPREDCELWPSAMSCEL